MTELELWAALAPPEWWPDHITDQQRHMDAEIDRWADDGGHVG
jgi:hypothetical protein